MGRFIKYVEMFVDSEMMGCPVCVGKEQEQMSDRDCKCISDEGDRLAEAFFTFKMPYCYSVHV